MGEAQGRDATGPTHWLIEFEREFGRSKTAEECIALVEPPPDLAQFTAKLYTAVAEAGHVAVAIHPTPSTGAPALFMHPEWQQVLRRKDTVLIIVDLADRKLLRQRIW
eukprot:6700738-Heterocapsa_arctica.AAC.1